MTDDKYFTKDECILTDKIVLSLDVFIDLLEEPEILPAYKAVEGKLFENINDQHKVAKNVEKERDELIGLFVNRGCTIKAEEGLARVFGDYEVLSMSEQD
jgi:hypothetical protein